MNEWKECRFSDFVEVSPQVNPKRGTTCSFVGMADLGWTKFSKNVLLNVNGVLSYKQILNEN